MSRDFNNKQLRVYDVIEMRFNHVTLQILRLLQEIPQQSTIKYYCFLWNEIPLNPHRNIPARPKNANLSEIYYVPSTRDKQANISTQLFRITQIPPPSKLIRDPAF